MIFLSSGVAQHKGFFKDEGLDAEIVVMGAAPSIAALSNGDIDCTLLTGTVIRAAIRGLPVRLGRRPDDELSARITRATGNQNNQGSQRQKKSVSPASAMRPKCWRE